MHVTCPQCDANYQIADEFEGKSLKCMGCKALFRARLNRAAIKFETQRPEGEHWPTTLPTIAPSRTPMNETLKVWGISAMLVVGTISLIACLIYVYRVNSPDNMLLDRNRTKPSVQEIQ